MNSLEVSSKLKALNLLGKMVWIEWSSSAGVSGKVFYFDGELMILEKENDFVGIPMNKMDEMMITVEEESGSK